MDTNQSRLSQAWSNFTDKLNEQAWFQDLKSKWEELDPQSRTYLQFAGLGGAVLLVLFILLSSSLSVRALKQELAEKHDLITLIRGATEEKRHIEEQALGASVGGEAQPWSAYFEGLAGQANVDHSALEVSAEKALPPAAGAQSKESLMDVKLKHVSVIDVVKYSLAIETGPRPVKLKHLDVDTKNDREGYMDATLSVSAFAPKTEK